MKIGIVIGGVASLEAQVKTQEEQIQQIVQAEEDGFDSFWLAQIFGADALTILALAGPRTSRIELGTGVIPTYSRHPFMLAQQALTVQAATGGRLTLGIGPSHKPVVESMWGLSYDRPAAHVREYLTVLSSLINENKVAFNGERIKAVGGIQVPGGTPCPIIIAALAPVMLRTAGEMADGTVTWMCGPKTIASHIAPRINAAAEEAGRPKPRIIVALPVAVTDDPKGARQRASQELAMYGQLENYRRVLDREGAAVPGDMAIVGSEAEVEKQLRELAEAGATDYAAILYRGAEADAGTRDLLKGMVGKI